MSKKVSPATPDYRSVYGLIRARKNHLPVETTKLVRNAVATRNLTIAGICLMVSGVVSSVCIEIRGPETYGWSLIAGIIASLGFAITAYGTLANDLRAAPHRPDGLPVACKILGFTLGHLSEFPLTVQSEMCHNKLENLAIECILAERAHPDDEFHPERLDAKKTFSDTYEAFLNVGFIKDVGYRRFFLHLYAVTP